MTINSISIRQQIIEYEISPDNSNCRIVNGYLVTDATTRRLFVQLILSKDPFNQRSSTSYLREWKAHNILYALHLFRKNTCDTDLNIHESKFRRFCYFIITIFSKIK